MGAIPSFLFATGRSVVTLADATPAGQQAAWRGALVARDLGLPLELLDADDDAAGRLARLAPRAGLLVLPYRRGHPVADCLLGTAPERIFRSVSVPTLVVKGPATTSYRRVLVPVELDEDAAHLIHAARCLSRAPRIRVLHVLDRGQEHSLRLADAPEQALRSQRQRRSRAAYAVLQRAISGAGASDRTAALVSFGDAGTRVMEVARASRAQLVVLGKRGLSAIEQLFTTSVSNRLIRGGGADVLLLPSPRRARAP